MDSSKLEMSYWQMLPRNFALKALILAVIFTFTDVGYQLRSLRVSPGKRLQIIMF